MNLHLKVFVNEESRRRARDKSDQDIINSKLAAKLDDFSSTTKYYETAIDNIRDTTSSVFEILYIQSALDAQDEIDRKSVSLWGYQDKAYNSNLSELIDTNSTPQVSSSKAGQMSHLKTMSNLPLSQNNVISIDKNCYSCANPNSIVLSAFKMA